METRIAKVHDVPKILELIDPLVQERILLGKEKVNIYESLQQFMVIEDQEESIVACGALHVIWDNLAEIRTLAVRKDNKGRGLGAKLVKSLVNKAGELGVKRIFCLSFETGFFIKQGFKVISDIDEKELLKPEVYAELLRSHDEGVAEFLELARVKPNTLGNTRMIKYI